MGVAKGVTLVALAFLAATVCIPKLQSTRVATPTNLRVMPTLSRAGLMALPKSRSCPQPGFTAMSVKGMENTLKQYGIPSSPLNKAALTQIAGMRDVSMAAQAKEEFSKLDPKIKGTLIKKGREVVVKASNLDVEALAGVTGPLGFWDPLGLSEGNADIAKYRRAELKHGRVCMLAALGIIVSERFHPVFDQWGDGEFVSAVASHFSATAGKNFWPAFWIMAAGHELATSLADYEGKEEADFGFDPLKLKPDDPEKLEELQNKELNNGRLAMVGAAGIIAQELVTGEGIFNQF